MFTTLNTLIIVNVLSWVALTFVLHLVHWKAYKAGVSAGYLIGCYKDDLDCDKHLRSKTHLKEAYKYIDKLESNIAWQLALQAEDELV